MMEYQEDRSLALDKRYTGRKGTHNDMLAETVYTTELGGQTVVVAHHTVIKKRTRLSDPSVRAGCSSVRVDSSVVEKAYFPHRTVCGRWRRCVLIT